MAPRIVMKTKTGLLSESPILIEKDDVISLLDVSMMVQKATKIPTSLHLYYDGDTMVNKKAFVEKINSPEINLWLYVKGSSSKAVKNVCTKLGIQQHFTVYFKNPTKNRQFENIKFDLSLSSTVADLKEAIKAKHNWLKVSWQTLVGKMNGKYQKVRDCDFLMNFHLQSNLIHEIEYYCFVKEKHWKEKLNFLHLPRIMVKIKWKPTGFYCMSLNGEELIFTLDDLKKKVEQEYGVPRHLQVIRNHMHNVPEYRRLKQIENQCLIPYFFDYLPTFVFCVLSNDNLVIEELPVDRDGTRMLVISRVTIEFRGQKITNCEITENTTILDIKRDFETSYNLAHTRQELYYIHDALDDFDDFDIHEPRAKDPIFLQDSQNLIDLILDLECKLDQNVSLHLDVNLEETEIERWCKDNKLVYFHEINVYLINKMLLTKVQIKEFDSVNWTLEKLKAIVSEKYEIPLNAIAFSDQGNILSSAYDFKCHLL